MRLILLALALTSCVNGKAPSVSDVKIYNGQKAQVWEFTHVLDIGTCTGSPIGPRLILTAAHCGNTLKNSGFRYKSKWLKWKCNKHPRYNTKTLENDYALCILDEALPDFLPLASVDVRKALSLKERVTIAGYGRPNSGKLYYGSTVVEKFRGQDVILDQKVHLGSGDSGGSAFRFGTRDVIGVQSRTFVKSKRSILNRTHDHEFRWFLADVALKHNLLVCGFTEECSNK